MFRRLNHCRKHKMQMKIFQTTLVTIFWPFTVFYNNSDLPQVKPDLISGIKNGIKLRYKLPNRFRLRVLES